MSKLIEKLKKLSQAAPPPMGFHTTRPAAENPTLLLIGKLPINSAAPATKYSGGADAVLLYGDKAEATVKEIQKTAKTLGDIPWGIYLAEVSDNKEPGVLLCDFVIFSPANKVNELPTDERLGKILEVESSMDDGLLRAVNDLPVDAVLVTDALETNETLTMHRLMIYRNLSSYIGKPIIVPVKKDISEAELKALRDAGIDGVMAEMDTAGGDNLKELEKKIRKLPPREAKKGGKGGVILPRVGTTAAPSEEEEDE
jgi:hypothetical protein